MDDKQLKTILNFLYLELQSGKSNPKLVLVKAVTAGMKYQENKIKEGINIVFENLNLPTYK